MFHKWLLLCVILFVLCPVHLFINEKGGNKLIAGMIECEKEWVLYGGKCFKVFGILSNRLNWHEASESCKRHGGHLATVQSKDVQEFLFAFLFLEADIMLWIGLNDIQNESHYVWDDGTKYNYSNWNPNEPSEWKDETEDCVHVIAQVSQGEPGEWNDVKCSNALPYICQVDEGKQKESSRDPTLCSARMGGGWKFGDSCYNFVTEKMTWENAEKHCQAQYRGNLVKVMNFNVNYFLKFILSNYSTDIWIGIKMKDRTQQQFSSGWNVYYTYWQKTPEDFVNGTCVIRTTEKFWEVVSCDEKYPFICETSNVSPPALRSTSEESTCPAESENWIDPGGEFCYFLDNVKRFNWYQAQFECTRKGGSLASFHSRREIYGLAPYLEYAKSPFQSATWRIFIGLYREENTDNEYVWADGSKVDYTYWDTNQPNKNSGKCVFLYVKFSRWYVGNCEEHNGYLCSVKKISPSILKIEAYSPDVVSPNITETEANSTGAITTNNTKTEAVSAGADGIPLSIFIGVTTAFLLLVVILLSVVIYFLLLRKTDRRRKSCITDIPLETINTTTFQQSFRSDSENDDQVSGYEDMD